MNLNERLEKITEIIKKEDFRQNKGLGNEVGYYIFDYPEAQELTVRNHIEFIKKTHNPIISGFEIVEFDLYNLAIEYIKERGFLDMCFDMEENDGLDYLVSAVVELLKMDTDKNYFTDYIESHTPESAVIFITGIGKIFPFIRSHSILNKLHQSMDRLPVIMFFPGKWDGQKLKLFSEIDDGNYYRAFPLIS